MWKIIINNLSEFRKLTIRDYCLNSLKLFNLSLLESKVVNEIVKKNPQNDFFPESLNLYNKFNNGEIEFIINFIINYSELDNRWFDIDNLYKNMSKQEIYKSTFNYINELSFFKRMIISPEELMSKDFTDDKLKTFLFLFFLPVWEENEMLFHHSKQIPLLCCSKINNEFFDVLLELMLIYEKEEILRTITDKNLNHLLIENFMENASKLHSFENQVNWEEVLPIYKIKKLLDINCSIKNIKETIPQRFLVLFEDIPEFLINLESRYLYEKLDSSLKININKKEDIIKI